MKKDIKGMFLISIIMLTVVLLILTSSVVIINQHNLGFTGLMERQAMARKVAEAGVEYALYELRGDPSWTGGPSGKVEVYIPEVSGKFVIDFNSSGAYPSVNNLLGGPVPNKGYKNQGIPGLSVDLIVTGTAGSRDRVATKRIRAILQGESFKYPMISSGYIKTSAADLSVKNGDPSSSQAGTIHSNSVRDDINNPDDCAVYCNNTRINLNGGLVTSQGNINILNLDAGSTKEPFSQAKYINPINVTSYVSKAKGDNSVQKIAGGTYVVKSDGLYLNGVSKVSPSGITLNGSKLIIKQDVCFEGNVKFEFDYNSFSGDPSALVASGVYLEPSGAGEIPSISVDGDLTVSGRLKGNGSFYVSGSANYLGETNIVAPDDPGVAVLCQKDLNMGLPTVSDKRQMIDIKGLLYTNGNANFCLLKADHPANPVNNLSPWPADWEDTDLSRVIDFGDGRIYTMGKIQLRWVPNEAFLFEPIGDDGKFDCRKNENYIKVCDDGSFACSNGDGYDNDQRNWGQVIYNPRIQTEASPASGGEIEMNYVKLDNLNDYTLYLRTELKVDENEIPRWGVHSNEPLNSDYTKKAERKNIYGVVDDYYTMINPDKSKWSTGPVPFGSTSGNKIPPLFRITGALVAVDPNNPVPGSSNPDNDSAGNININIGSGKVDLIFSEKYVKLFNMRCDNRIHCVTWSEI